MRLGQLSRQLDVKSAAIVEVLKEHFREVNNHPNIKIKEEELEFLMSHFSKSVAELDEPQEQKVHPVAEVTEEINLPSREGETKKEKPEFIKELRPKEITLEKEFNEKKKQYESFKAEKPELEGLKVLGKIELPEPKPKAEEKPKKVERESNTMNEKDVRKRHKKGRRNDKRHRNPVEAQRKREEYLAKKRKEKEEKRLKELKKMHYEQNVKAKIEAQPKKKKKKKKFVEAQQEIKASHSTRPTKQKSPSKNPIVRFWKWLNGDYDKFN